jgi:coenzyme Q-binding protein COQ10
MPKIVNKKFLPYGIDKLYAIITDVERYPEFIPWFKKITITAVTDSIITTDVTIEFMFIRDHYTSIAELKAPHEVEGIVKASVVVTMVEGPFDHFITTWSLQGVDDESCLIEFECNFSFNNKLYDDLAGIALKPMNKKIMDAFIKRVNNIIL